MAERKSFLLRVDRELLDAMHRWAGDELRSLNGQIEFVLRRALRQSGRLPPRTLRPDDRFDADNALPGDTDERTLDDDATGEP